MEAILYYNNAMQDSNYNKITRILVKEEMTPERSVLFDKFNNYTNL